MVHIETQKVKVLRANQKNARNRQASPKDPKLHKLFPSTVWEPLHPKPYTLNPKPYTQNPKPKTLHPKTRSPWADPVGRRF